MSEEQYISGEQYQEMQHEQYQQQPKRRLSMPLPALIGGLVVVIVIAFFAGWLLGTKHQKSQDSKLVSTSTGQQSSPGLSTQGSGPILCSGGQSCSSAAGGSGGATLCSNGTCTSANSTPITGTVTATSATSITIQLSSGSAETFSIANTTGFSAGTGSGSLSAFSSGDVQVGETVSVVPSSSGSTQAQIIIANPPSSD